MTAQTLDTRERGWRVIQYNGHVALVRRMDGHPNPLSEKRHVNQGKFTSFRREGDPRDRGTYQTPEQLNAWLRLQPKA